MSIASRITSMENNIRNAYHGLDSIGIDTTNTNKNIENISALLEDFYDSLPKVSGSGTNINLSPTKIGRITSQINGDTQQNGTPTPDSPVAIETVTGLQTISVLNGNDTDTYDINLGTIELNKIGNYQDNIKKSTGKNLFDKSTITIGYINADGSITTNQSYATSDFIEIDSSLTYSKTVTNSPRVKLYDKDKNLISTESISDISSFGNAGTYTIPYENAKYIRFTTRVDQEPSSIDKVMFVVGDTIPTEYEPYLPKGTWYIEKNIGKVVLDGSENWAKIQIGTTGKYYYQRNPRPVLGQQTANGKLVLSNYFKATNTWSEIVVGIWLDVNMIIKTEGSLDGTETVEDFKTWLSTHNTTVYYVLETPTYEEITNETLITQLENWYYAMSKNGQTNISVEGDLPIILDVSALKGEE